MELFFSQWVELADAWHLKYTRNGKDWKKKKKTCLKVHCDIGRTRRPEPLILWI